ncbi:DUF433 domain-containing protein [Aphanothece sacrum]|uniref:DUF433 domain-containing protein n=1 Tax=Aphanothece sacrum FPU1 TaxID=1920663 RepID=A0A401IE99_APHSA|nr:DUF433 domain-containing protein [Aphanothece sacrum]GBF79564.1 hypothetical protein AsFPU1_0960 [Aphanothece sacrum FPU1]GBF86272.1 hypothetical protein AsFPU3_3343 [Aphanothece sacrum FPU3]
MLPYSLKLPPQLQQEAEKYATDQGITLDNLIIWAIAEKIGSLKQKLDDPNFPDIVYCRNIEGEMIPKLRGTNIQVKTLVIAIQNWRLTPKQVADEYGINEEQVINIMAFYESHRQEIDAVIATDKIIESIYND